MTRPDPLTVLLEFPQTWTARALVTRQQGRGQREGPDRRRDRRERGRCSAAPTSRMLRIALSEAVAYRVRSEKSSVIVEFERVTGKSVPYVLPPVSRDIPDIADLLASGGSGKADPIESISAAGTCRPSGSWTCSRGVGAVRWLLQAAAAAARAHAGRSGHVSGAGREEVHRQPDQLELRGCRPEGGAPRVVCSGDGPESADRREP